MTKAKATEAEAVAVIAVIAVDVDEDADAAVATEMVMESTEEVIAEENTAIKDKIVVEDAVEEDRESEVKELKANLVTIPWTAKLLPTETKPVVMLRDIVENKTKNGIPRIANQEQAVERETIGELEPVMAGVKTKSQ